MRRFRTGEVYLAALESRKRHATGQTYPVIIFQTPDLDGSDRVLVVPIVDSIKRAGEPGTCFVAAGEGGLKEGMLALANEIRSIPKKNLGWYSGRLPPKRLEAVKVSILRALGIIDKEGEE